MVYLIQIVVILNFEPLTNMELTPALAIILTLGASVPLFLVAQQLERWLRNATIGMAGPARVQVLGETTR